MVGLVISDSFLLTGVWNRNGDSLAADGITRVPFTESIRPLLHNEGELNAVLASALRKAKETNSFDTQDIVVGLPDSFVEHTIVEGEQDLSKNDYMDYIHWLDAKKCRPRSQSVYIFGQVYYPADANIHVCTVSRALIRTLKFSITEMGGNPYWVGPVSSTYLDGSGISEAAMIHRLGNKYTFMKVQNNRFDMGTVTFSGGVPRVAYTTDPSEDITLAALGLEKSDLDDIPVFCPQKLGRQAISAWELSDFRVSSPFDGVDVDEVSIAGLPQYEANILSQLMTSIALDYSFNFFEEPGITDFFFTKVIPGFDMVEIPEIPVVEIVEDEEKPKRDQPQSITGFAIAILLIVGAFIGFNYLKLQDELNNPFFGVDKGFSIERSGIDDTAPIEPASKEAPLNLLQQSRAISSSILTLLTQTDLNRYNALTITNSFLSLEYLSGTNPNIENIIGVDPTSFSVEATGKDSTIFLWYYSFDLPMSKEDHAAGEISKMDLMIQLDTTLTDYTLKYFEQVFTKNQIYGPLLIWVRGKADILQASAIISNVDDTILLRKFVLFNKSDQPNPRSGFYVSILED